MSNTPAALTWAAVVWQAVGNTMFGYGVWGWLLARYPAATVAPLALLVPVFGMTSAAALLGEPLPGWKLAAAALVMSGLVLGLFWPRVRRALRTRSGRTRLAQRLDDRREIEPAIPGIGERLIQFARPRAHRRIRPDRCRRLLAQASDP